LLIRSSIKSIRHLDERPFGTVISSKLNLPISFIQLKGIENLNRKIACSFDYIQDISVDRKSGCSVSINWSPDYIFKKFLLFNKSFLRSSADCSLQSTWSYPWKPLHDPGTEFSDKVWETFGDPAEDEESGSDTTVRRKA